MAQKRRMKRTGFTSAPASVLPVIRSHEDRLASIRAAHVKNAHILESAASLSNQRERALRNEVAKKRFKIDPIMRLAATLRNRVNCALKAKSARKVARTMKMIGCSPRDLRVWLEIQFREGMSWDNHGDWEIDHIRPCASFNLLEKDQQLICFHFSNLQPLWKSENRKKSKTWNPT